jgi:hypothetical protein
MGGKGRMKQEINEGKWKEWKMFVAIRCTRN